MSRSGDIAKLVEQTAVCDRPRAPSAGLGRIGAYLERLRTAIGGARVQVCQVCGSGMMRTHVIERQPIMGELGPPELTIVCDNANCGHCETRLYGSAGPIIR